METARQHKTELDGDKWSVAYAPGKAVKLPIRWHGLQAYKEGPHMQWTIIMSLAIH